MQATEFDTPGLTARAPRAKDRDRAEREKFLASLQMIVRNGNEVATQIPDDETGS